MQLASQCRLRSTGKKLPCGQFTRVHPCSGSFQKSQCRRSVGKSRPWRPGLLEALTVAVQELVATWEVPWLPPVLSQCSEQTVTA